MRLLFDEQLSNRLPRLLADCYPESLHVRQFAAQDEVSFLELGPRRIN